MALTYLLASGVAETDRVRAVFVDVDLTPAAATTNNNVGAQAMAWPVRASPTGVEGR